MTIRVGVKIKPKNPVEVLYFHKIQVQLIISRICTPKIIERGISRKHAVLDKKKKHTHTHTVQQPLGSTELVSSRRPGIRSPQ